MTDLSIDKAGFCTPSRCARLYVRHATGMMTEQFPSEEEREPEQQQQRGHQSHLTATTQTAAAAFSLQQLLGKSHQALIMISTVLQPRGWETQPRSSHWRVVTSDVLMAAFQKVFPSCFSHKTKDRRFNEAPLRISKINSSLLGFHVYIQSEMCFLIVFMEKSFKSHSA